MKFKYIHRTIIIAFAFLGLVATSNAWSEEIADEKTKEVAYEDANFKAQANNPLASMEAFNFHNYFAGKLTDDDDITSDDPSNTLWLRWAKPVAVGETKWLIRSSLPVNTWPTPYPTGEEGRKTGIGDFNIFAAYLMDTDPGISFGFGPQFVAPTATDGALGSEKWSAGFANVLFNGTSKKFQYGYLLTWQYSFAGKDDRPTVNMAVMQPFGMYQLGGGTYLRSSSMWSYNLENDSYSVPLGLGIGYVVKKGKTIYNFFLEPQYSVLDSGPGQPEWQILLGFNIQLMGINLDTK